MSRNLSLSPRQENVKSQQQTRHVVHFNLKQIKDRFDDSIKDIKKNSIYMCSW